MRSHSLYVSDGDRRRMTNKKGLYQVAAFALLFLSVGIGIGRIYFSSEFTKWMNRVDNPGVTQNAAQQLLEQRQPRNPNLTKSPGVLPGKMPQLDQDSTKPLAGSSKNETTEFKTASSSGAEVSEGDSVIGNPFPTSASVQDSCKKNPDCDRVNAGLKEMAEEPRDVSWATNMEDQLRDYSASFGSGKYTIRAVECRESLCAIEVASVYGILPPALPYGSSLDRQLSSWDSWTGHETDQLGAQVTVTLLIYRRR